MWTLADSDEARAVAIGGAFLGLHGLACFLAYSAEGTEAAVYTVFFPIVGAIYWGVYVWAEQGLSTAPAIAVFGSLVLIAIAVLRSRQRRPSSSSQVAKAVVAPASDPPVATMAPPTFQPFSDEEWRRVTSQVREQFARGDLKADPSTYDPRRILTANEIQAIASRAAPPGYYVREISWFDDIRGRRPSAYLASFSECWIAFLATDVGAIGLRASQIVAVRDADGEVIYVGSANDEG